ncbi:tripartite tricarboxylate transporter substrate binding protein [Roseomonas sp. NAR14]|uniref:Tripartite tricarboxylate transporter substrate binding protein n=1 Tax=Roseomonas acroporae TaxID=2937791 RepID=A0A9X2BTT4_9PROT|nr:tripartite tricarboxylate transporter substrate binding protein [Roseomonas acroporae]MCK8784662.1 tripartite tricarboxylate transporter substrate binding protein [Roseomonas acroporae]
MPTRRTLLILPALAALARASPARAGFPDRPLRIVVPFAPGGNSDTNLRTVTPRMAELLGQDIAVENRPGGNGDVGIEAVLRARPDGYTLLGASTGPIINGPLLQAGPRRDPLRELAPVGLVSLIPMALIVHPDMPARTLGELVRYSRQRAGGVTIGTSGIGGANHLPLELFKAASGANIVHVPFRGGASAVPELLAGNINGTLIELSTVLALHREGRARILAVTSARRSPLLPGVPTFIECGVPGFTAATFVGLFAPSGTPEAAIARVSEALATALSDPDTRARLLTLGAEITEPEERTPEAFATWLRRECERAHRAVQLAGIRPG